MRGWALTLRAGGRMIVQETAAVQSSDPALARYYEVVGDLQRHHGQDLTIGARLGQLAEVAGPRVVHSAPRVYRPPARAMARLHVLNLQNWRDDPYARATFDAGERADERCSSSAAAGPLLPSRWAWLALRSTRA